VLISVGAKVGFGADQERVSTATLSLRESANHEQRVEILTYQGDPMPSAKSAAKPAKKRGAPARKVGPARKKTPAKKKAGPARKVGLARKARIARKAGPARNKTPTMKKAALGKNAGLASRARIARRAPAKKKARRARKAA
jgi:hypothetical protein